ncbi:MAG: TPM domain-containing protein [Cyclobacteriaceae bacterium]|nr:TPM domain-containing protein [Cyclobacteriaceae bacterium]
MHTIFKLAAVILVGLIISCGTDNKAKTSSSNGYRIIDNSYVLTNSQKDSIETLIKKLDQEIGSQIAVLIIDTLGKEKLETFSLRMAEELRLGRSTHNDGLLITIVTMEKKMRIEVGTGLENIIKDEIAGRIIQDDMAPLFRQEKYGQGIYLAVDKISTLIIENRDLVGTEPR